MVASAAGGLPSHIHSYGEVGEKVSLSHPQGEASREVRFEDFRRNVSADLGLQ